MFQDIDECALGTHDCEINALCNNSDGSFTCSCLPGFTGIPTEECTGIPVYGTSINIACFIC